MNTTENNSSKTPDQGKRTASRKTSKQVVALIGVLLLALLYIVTLIVAIFDNSETGRWFMICIFATVAMPILLWIYTWMYGKLTGRHTIADTSVFPGTDRQAPSDTTTSTSNIADNDQ